MNYIIAIINDNHMCVTYLLCYCTRVCGVPQSRDSRFSCGAYARSRALHLRSWLAALGLGRDREL